MSTNYLVEELKTEAIPVIEAFDNYLITFKKDSERASEILATNVTMIDAIQKGNRQTIFELAKKNVDIFEVENITVVDKKGNVFVRTYAPDKFGDNILDKDMLVQNVIKNHKAVAGILPGTTVPLYIGAAAPVYDNVGNFIAVIVAGNRFDNTEFLDNLKSRFHMDFTLFKKDTRVTTTIMKDGKRIVGTKLTPSIADIVLNQKKTFSGRAEVLDIPMITYYKPLIGLSGVADGIIFVGINENKALAGGKEMIKEVIIFSIISMIIIALIMLFLMKRVVVNPLSEITETINNVSRGNFNVDLEVNGKDELAAVTSAMKNLVGVVDGLIDESHKIGGDIEVGIFDTRVDEANYPGSFKKLSNSINGIVETLTTHICNISQFVAGIAIGNIPERSTLELQGKYVEIQDNLNACIDNINSLVATTNGLIGGAIDGRLDTRADASKHQGAYYDIINGINELLTTILDPIQKVFDVLKVMATGDLTKRIEVEYKGDYADLVGVTNDLGDSLSELISQLQETVHTTASAAAEISATADTLASASVEQSSQTDEVAGAMEEMSRTVTDNASSATQTANVAKNSGEVATEGGKVVNDTVSKMREIADVVKTSANNIMELGESSKKIGEIISVIDDIADQTNLLALNAAIEAARAGEQGRGFAVVADEVRKLAENTAEATKQISDMISGIQTETDKAVIAMQQGTKEVESGIALADNAGDSLQMIINSTNELLDMINQIAVASEQQSSTSDEISKNVATIAKISASSAQNVGDIATTAGELAQMAESLTSIVDQFKINNSSKNRGGYMLEEANMN